jgi:hypothetical protein
MGAILVHDGTPIYVVCAAHCDDALTNVVLAEHSSHTIGVLMRGSSGANQKKEAADQEYGSEYADRPRHLEEVSAGDEIHPTARAGFLVIEAGDLVG